MIAAGPFVVAALLGCSDSTTPPTADDPIPLTGTVVKLDELDAHKYLHYAVGIHIEAPPDVVWAVLTDAPGYPAWNTTVTGIEGTIASGADIVLSVKIAPDQSFNLNVSTFEAPKTMVWEDGNAVFQGLRDFHLTEADGGTDWTMRETFTGRMSPMIATQLPDFGPDFESFAADLKAEAEKRAPKPEPEPEPADGEDGAGEDAPKKGGGGKQGKRRRR